MERTTIDAFLDELYRLEKTSGALSEAVQRNIMPISGAFLGGAGGAALGGGEAYLHNLGATPENQESVAGRAMAGGLLGAGVGGAGGYLGSVGLDKGKAFLGQTLNDLSYSTTNGATRGATEELERVIPKITKDTVDAAAYSSGAAPVTAASGFLSNALEKLRGLKSPATPPTPPIQG